MYDDARASADPGARGHRAGRAFASTSRRCAAQSTLVEQELDRLASRVYELAGEEFNINSPKQLSEILFDKLQLPALKRSGARPRPRRSRPPFEVLEELALTHELPQLILEWRGAAEAEGHLHRRAAAARPPGDRPRPHLLQPGGRRDGAAEQQRSQPAEHPDPHRARTRDPPRVRRRAAVTS